LQYGYARVSSTDQDTALQVDAFARAGVTNIIQEKRSARRQRPLLDALLRDLTAADELVVYKVDRIARSIRDLSAILDHVQDRGAAFRSLTEPFDTRIPAGRMMVQMLGVIAEFEWTLIRDRSIAGMHAAVERGATLGRKRALTPAQEAAAYQAIQAGESMSSIARRYEVHLSSIKRARLRIEKPDSPAVARRFACAT